MEFEDLNLMEQIGLAFITGFTAGSSFVKADEEIEQEAECEGKHFKQDEKDADVTIEVGKLEGDKAKEFMKMIKKITGEDK